MRTTAVSPVLDGVGHVGLAFSSCKHCVPVIDRDHRVLQASQHLLGRPRDVFELAPAAALFAQIAIVEQLVCDLFERQAGAGGVFRPSQIRAVKIARIRGISMKLFKRLNPLAFSAPGLPRTRFLHHCGRIVSHDAGKELRCAGIDTPFR